MKGWLRNILVGGAILVVVGLSFEFSTGAVYAGDCRDGGYSSEYKRVYNNLTRMSHGRWDADSKTGISSVGWAIEAKASSCDSKELNKSPNVCSLWIGPVGDSTTSTIKIDPVTNPKIDPVTNPTFYMDDGGDVWTKAVVYGMCTSNNGANTATNIKIFGYDNLFGPIGSVSRGGWGNPIGTPVNLNVTKFMEAASSREEGGVTIYELFGVPVGRCHEHVPEGSSNLNYNSTDCNTDSVDITLMLTNTYLAESNVSSGETSAYAKTGITGFYKTANASDITIKKGNTVSIRFSHNVFATTLAKNTNWNVSTSGNGWSLTNNGGGGGEASFKKDDRYKGYYIGGPRNASSGGRTFILRDERNVTFNENGTYEFCEMATVGDRTLTKVCAKVIVSDEPVPSGTCETIKSLTDGTSEVFTRVFNQRGLGSAEYGDWTKKTYAMPTDVIAWIDCYLPGAQVYADNIISNFKTWDGDGGEGVCHNTTNEEKTMTQAYADYYGHEWTNKFKVYTESPRGFNDSNLNKWGPFYWPDNGDWKTYTNGDSTVKQVDHNHEISKTNDVSKTFTDTITTPNTPIWSSWRNDGRGYHPWTCCSCSVCGCCCTGECEDGGCCGCDGCCCCSYQHTNLYNIGDAGTGSGESQDDAWVRIPYNYINTTEHTVSSRSSGVVYAGETISVSGVKAVVNERYNSVVEDTYTTKVDDAEVRLIGYVTTGDHINDGSFTREGDHESKICNWLPQKQCNREQTTGVTTLNESGELHGYTEYYGNWSGDYNVFDASAGDYMCFVTAVYPATSGIAGGAGDDDENHSQGDRNTHAYGDKNWRISAPQCIIIAKRPSVQILGGDLYSNGVISTSTSEKKQLLDVNGYEYPADNPTNRTGLIYNGSWVEEGIIATSSVYGLSSGASLGYVPDPRETGARNATKFCLTRAPLSIANYDSNNITGICPTFNVVGRSGIVSTVKNRKALVEYWDRDLSQSEGDKNDYIYLSNDDSGNVKSATGKNIRLYDIDGDATITGGEIEPDTTRVVRAGGTVIIGGDIKYSTEAVLRSGNVPKVVIYGKNIHISCEVNTVDAILIAEDKVQTCYEGGDINDENRSRQLTINGIVISNKIDLGRTYGNSVGTGSGLPAEIINYDTSALLWGRFMAGSGESDTMTVTYQHELAPRY